MFAPPQEDSEPSVRHDEPWVAQLVQCYGFLHVSWCFYVFFYESRVEEHPMLRCISMFLCACVSMYFYVFLCSLR